jgi:hypothetical protein
MPLQDRQLDRKKDPDLRGDPPVILISVSGMYRYSMDLYP